MLRMALGRFLIIGKLLANGKGLAALIPRWIPVGIPDPLLKRYRGDFVEDLDRGGLSSYFIIRCLDRFVLGGGEGGG